MNNPLNEDMEIEVQTDCALGMYKDIIITNIVRDSYKITDRVPPIKLNMMLTNMNALHDYV